MDETSVGFEIRAVSFFYGLKSRRLIPQEEVLPTGEDKILICFDCAPDELKDWLGFQTEDTS